MVAFGLGSMPSLFDPNFDPWAMFDQLMQQSSGMSGSMGLPSGTGSVAETIEPPAGLTGQDYLVETSVDKTDLYQGEQLIYTMRFFRAVNPAGQLSYAPPVFTGFWSKEMDDQAQYRTSAGGRNYLVSEIQTVLNPTVVGQVTIDPAAVTVPGGIYSQGGQVRSQPLQVTVQPLPGNAPASFSGAVGEFNIQSEVDRAEAVVGDTVTQRLTVAGAGNIETMGDPAWAESSQWRTFDSKATTETRMQGDVLTGVRVYERVLIPTEAGQLEIPSVEFSYFDPVKGKYQTVTSQQTLVSVEPGAASVVSAAMVSNDRNVPNSPSLLSDLRPCQGCARYLGRCSYSLAAAAGILAAVGRARRPDRGATGLAALSRRHTILQSELQQAAGPPAGRPGFAGGPP